MDDNFENVRSSRVQLLDLIVQLNGQKRVKPDLLDTASILADPCTGAEIGVALAKTSHYLLYSAPGLQLHLVDPWMAADAASTWRATGDKRAKMSQEDNDARFFASILWLKDFNPTFGPLGRWREQRRRHRAVFWKMPSVQAASRLEAQLDFVFIDGAHDYDNVRADLTAWLPRVRPGGLLCGHDYSSGNKKFAGVKKAVDELAATTGFNLHLGCGSIWWMWKS